MVVTLSSGACDVWPRVETRTFRVENLGEEQTLELLGPYVYSDRESNPGSLSVAMGAVTVRETTDNLEKIERVLAEFDKPLPIMRLRFQLIAANGAAGEPDPRIADVVEQLKGLFRFDGYRLLGETFVNVGGEFQVRFPDLPQTVGAAFAVQRQPGVVEIGGLEIWPDERTRTRAGGLTLAAGQTVVVGNAGSRNGETVILTVRAEPVAGG
jgi:hypothetical protein